MALKKENQSLGDKLISNTFYLFLDWASLAFFSFVFWSVTAKFLKDPNLVGIVSTSINFAILVSSFSTLGMINALKKLVPEIKRTKGEKGVYSLVKISIKPVLVSLLITFLVLLFFSSHLSSLINIPTGAFLITILSIVSLSIFDFLGSVIYGLQNMKRLFLTDTVQIILRIILTVLLILTGLSYSGPLLAFLIAYFFISIFRFSVKYIKNAQRAIYYKKLFSYSTPALIALVSTSLIVNLPYVLLSALKNTEATGIFTIAFTISSIVIMVPHTLNSALFPILSSLSLERKTKRKQGYLTGIILRYSLFLTIPLSIILIIFSKHVVLIYSTSEFLQATLYFPILIPAGTLFGCGSIFVMNIYAIGKPKLHRNIMIASAILFLILSIILTSYFSILGLSISFLSVMIFRFLLGLKYITKCLKIEFFLKDLSKIFLSSLIISLILILFEPIIPDILTLILFFIPLALAYVYILLILKFYRTEDVKVLIYFGNRIPFIGKYILSIANFVKNML